jgi:HPt (histidine-containing phosphotransfer) domain-containing protein
LQEGALDVAARYEGENAAIAARVGEVLAALRRQGGTDIEGRIVEMVMELVSGERQAAEVARSALRDREVENLQRRIHKLNESLGQTEKRLQQVAATRQVDQGISSVYREVQGVGAEDQYQERKKELMAEIFKANLALQQTLRQRRGG